MNDTMNSLDASNKFTVVLTTEEKVKCLIEIINKLNKVLYVYDKTMEAGSNYNYKVFCGGILLYISSSNSLFNGELINAIVNLNTVINSDLDKQQIKRIIFESKNETQYLLEKYQAKLNAEREERTERAEHEDQSEIGG